MLTLAAVTLSVLALDKIETALMEAVFCVAVEALPMPEGVGSTLLEEAG